MDFDSRKPLADVSTEQLEQVIQWADLLVFSRLDNPRALAVAGAARKAYYIPILMEMDDLPMELNEDSWAFDQYRQDRLYAANDAPLWALEQMKLSDGIIVTNAYLQMRVKKLVPEKRVHIIPNTIDPSLITPTVKKQTIIGWGGGSNHLNDLELVRPAMLAILKKFPTVTFQTFGLQPPWTVGVKGCRHIPWVTFNDYYKTLSSTGMTIGIAPLVDNAFNRCKSNLRFLEHAALLVPTVASSVGPYQTIRDNVTGYHATSDREWYTKLSTLITRPKTALRLAHNAYHFARVHHNPERWADYYVKLFQYYTVKYARGAKYQNLQPQRTPAHNSLT